MLNVFLIYNIINLWWVSPILWPPDVKSQLTGKDPDAGKDWRQEEKGVAEDEMVVWHHWDNGRKFDQTQEIVKDREAWHVYGVTKSRTRLSDWTTARDSSGICYPWEKQTFLTIRLLVQVKCVRCGSREQGREAGWDALLWLLLCPAPR